MGNDYRRKRAADRAASSRGEIGAFNRRESWLAAALATSSKFSLCAILTQARIVDHDRARRMKRWRLLLSIFENMDKPELQRQLIAHHQTVPGSYPEHEPPPTAVILGPRPPA